MEGRSLPRLNRILCLKVSRTLNCRRVWLRRLPSRQCVLPESSLCSSSQANLKVPDNVKLQKETVLSLVKGSTVFINYLGMPRIHTLLFNSFIVSSRDVCFLLLYCVFTYQTIFPFSSSAHDVAQSRQHKSISASDVVKALEIMQFRTVSLQAQHELNGKYRVSLNLINHPCQLAMLQLIVNSRNKPKPDQRKPELQAHLRRRKRRFLPTREETPLHQDLPKGRARREQCRLFHYHHLSHLLLYRWVW